MILIKEGVPSFELVRFCCSLVMLIDSSWLGIGSILLSNEEKGEDHVEAALYINNPTVPT